MYIAITLTILFKHNLNQNRGCLKRAGLTLASSDRHRWIAKWETLSRKNRPSFSFSASARRNAWPRFGWADTTGILGHHDAISVNRICGRFCRSASAVSAMAKDSMRSPVGV